MATTDDDLDPILAEMAGDTWSEPADAALMTRILADAATVQAGFAGVRSAPVRRAAPIGRLGGGWLGGLNAWVGGGGALAGLVLATASGFFLGLYPPAGLDGLSHGLAGAAGLESLDLFSSSDSLWAEIPE